MGRAARREYERRYTAERNYELTHGNLRNEPSAAPRYRPIAPDTAFRPGPDFNASQNLARNQISSRRNVMSVALITGSAGLVGSEAVAYFASLGMEVVGIDNGMRAEFFGKEASTRWVRDRLCAKSPTTTISKPTSATASEFRRFLHTIAVILRSSSTPPPSLRTIGPQAIPRPTSRSMRTGHPSCWRPRAIRSRRRFYFHVDQQGLRRLAQFFATRGKGNALGG